MYLCGQFKIQSFSIIVGLLLGLTAVLAPLINTACIIYHRATKKIIFQNIIIIEPK